jgi:uncharacterized peroxidase-related enzyme
MSNAQHVSRLPTVDPELALGTVKELLEKTRVQLGRVPNLYRTMANAPAALEGYLGFRAALVRGQLSDRLREQLALLLAEENGCDYCVSAHTFRGRKIGISREELIDNRHAEASDAKTAAALQFARAVNAAKGAVSDGEIASVRAAGWSDGELAEIVAHVALNAYSNYFAKLAQPVLDFPRIEEASSHE